MFLGIDLGTTNVKAVLTDPAGTVVSVGSAGVAMDHRPGGGAEQSMADIWHAVIQAVTAAVGDRGRDVAAVGVSSQGGSIQILDTTGQEVGPVISWMDRRGGPFNEARTATLGSDYLRDHAGHARSLVVPGQLRRLAAEGSLPEGFALGFVGDRIVHRLTGRAAHDTTSLAITCLANPVTGLADADILAELGLDESRLPDLIEATTPAGALCQAAAAELNLPAGIPVSPAVHDQYASALGAACLGPGEILFGSGTAWVVLACTAEPVDPTGGAAFLARHVLPDRWGLILSMINGGSALGWASKLMGLDSDDLDEALQAVPLGCDGLGAIPHLTRAGLTPQPGALVGLELGHTPAHILRAMLEGLVCELRYYLETLLGDAPGPARLVATGRAATGQVTPQLLANVVGCEVACLDQPAVSAAGAATIAAALLEPSPLEDLAAGRAETPRLITPDADASACQSLYRHYRDLLRHLSDKS